MTDTAAASGRACPIPRAVLRDLLEQGRLLGAEAVALVVDGRDAARVGDDVAGAGIEVPVRVRGETLALVRANGAGDAVRLEQAARVTAARVGEAWAAAEEIDSLAGEVVHAYDELHLMYELGEALGDRLTVAAAADIILDRVAGALEVARVELRLADGGGSVFARGGEGADGPRLTTTLRSAGRVVGELVLIRAADAPPFSSNDGKLLDGVGALAGSAIGNARLYEALGAREAHLRAVLDNVADGIAEVTERGLIESFNPAAERIFGYAADEVAGKHFGVLVGQDEAAYAGDLGHRVGSHETVGRRKDGSTFPMDIAIGEMRLEGQRRFIVSVRDSTVRKLTEEALTRTERLRALGQLASGVAHDLNQSLGIIAGFGYLAIETLDDETPDLAGLRSKLRLVVQAAMDGSEAVNRLLLFGRGHREGGRERVDVGAVLAQVADLTAPRWRDATQAEGRPITLETSAEGEVAILGWGASLRELFTNLVLNAVDAMPEGGKIRLTARRKGDSVEVGVSDSGVGMTPEVKARAFEPFFSTKGARGTGMGLAMVFGIIEQHGAQIDIDSTPGEGTTFRLTFSAADPSAAPARAPVAVDGAARPLRILAVDDQPEIGILVSEVLGQEGHTVTAAVQGEEALEILAGDRFDVVVTDIGLGTGMNGWELARQVHARWPEVRLVMATGWGATIDPDEAREHGVEAVLAKPYRPAELRRVIAAVASSLA